MSVDGVAAANTMLSFGTWRSGYCLECVWTAYKDNGAVSDGLYYPTAYSAWTQTPANRRHEGDANPPAGVPVYWGPKSSSSAGDIVISIGGGMVVATDCKSPARIGTMSIADRGRQIGRPYLGWTETILNYPIAYAGGGVPVAGDIGGDDVFIISNNIPGHAQKGTAWVAVAQGGGAPRATTLYGGDNFPGVPVIQFVNNSSWDNFKKSIAWA